jgi:nucleolar MIF4G domain-containing protein 1
LILEIVLVIFFQSVLAHEPLRVSLEDLHSAESKGKWWLIGAAWGGDPLVDKQTGFTKTTGVSASNEEMTADEDSNDLVKLARSQGMNTDIRRGIFVVLMSSNVWFLPSSKLIIRLIL